MTNIQALEIKKILVVYYSLEGHCHEVANYLSLNYGFDTLTLQPIKDLDPASASKHWMGRLQVLFNQSVPLTQLPKDLEKYDLILLGTPVWMGSYAPAIQTLIDEIPMSNLNIALFTTYEKDAGDVFNRLQTRLKGANIIGEISLSTSTIEKGDYKEQLDNWLYSLFH